MSDRPCYDLGRVQNQPGDDGEVVGAARLANLGRDGRQAGGVPDVVEALYREGQER